MVSMSRETADEIDLAAAEWAARVDRGLTVDEEQALDAWLTGDPRRAGAYGKVHGISLYTRRVKALGVSYEPAKFRPSGVSLSRRGVLLAGGGALAAGVAGVAMIQLGMIERGQRYSTRLGEVNVTPLADGSVMTLNTASRVLVNFSGEARTVHLLEGEALFDVAKDVTRPFVVEAGETSVRAVGTSFSVRRLASTPVRVLVREGVVEVSRRAMAASAPVRIAANTRAIAPVRGEAIAAIAVAAPEVGRELAWREGRIAFEGETLLEAAEQFTRYSSTRIVIDDPSVAAEEITGLFQANDPVGFAQSVAISFDLGVEISTGEVRLHRRL